MSELSMCFFLVATCEGIGINFSPYTINSNCEVMIGNCCIPSLYAPEWLRKTIDCCRRIENYFSTVESECHPMKWMMSSIAYIYGNFSKLSFKHRVTCLPFHIISWLVKISHSRNMTFLLCAKNVSMIIYHYSSVVQCLFCCLAL